MCIAIAKPAGVTITKATLRECFDRNDDGAGFMFCDGQGGVQIRKPYFKFKDFYRALRAAESAHPESPFGLHFRIATSGELDKENCHPHRVNASMALIHNGILNIKVPKDSTQSDTVMFTNGVMKVIPSNWELFGGIKWLLERFLGTSNKIVVLKGDGEFVILNEEAGHWHEGAWYSNYSYKPTVRYTGGNKGSYFSDDSTYPVRPWCRGCSQDLASNERGGYCDMCREIQRLTADAKSFPRLVRSKLPEYMERANEVGTKAMELAEATHKRGLKITAENIVKAVEAMMLELGKVVPLAMGPGDANDGESPEQQEAARKAAAVLEAGKEATRKCPCYEYEIRCATCKAKEAWGMCGEACEGKCGAGSGEKCRYESAAPGGPSLPDGDTADDGLDDEGGVVVVTEADRDEHWWRQMLAASGSVSDGDDECGESN